MKPLERPIVSIDVETTGTDPAVDRIIQLGVFKQYPGENLSVSECTLFNPGIPIPPKSTEIHGITDEMVKNAISFKEIAPIIRTFLEECDLIGFNLAQFDIPILWEEFYRCGIEWNLTGTRVIDAGVIFKKMAPRTLEAAASIYAIGHEHKAHNALSDALVSYAVFEGQQAQHPEIAAMTMDELHAFSKFNDNIDLAGKLVMIDGKACYGFGKLKGTPICEDMGYADWMLQRNFSANTKMHLRDICEKIMEEERQLYEKERESRLEPDVPF